MNKGGRPLKFKTPKALETAIQEYFDSCWHVEPILDKKGNPVCDKDGNPMERRHRIKPYTVTGLAHFLDTSRQTLLEYQGERPDRVKKDKRYADAITRAKTAIEAFAEESLYTPKISTGVIFNLANNFGWKDTKHQVHDVDGTLADLMREEDEGDNETKTKKAV